MAPFFEIHLGKKVFSLLQSEHIFARRASDLVATGTVIYSESDLQCVAFDVYDKCLFKFHFVDND